MRDALAISNFLRQHDLVQVQWVILSSANLRNTPARRLTLNESFVTVQDTSARSADAAILVFDGPMAIVGGGVVDGALLVELAARGVALVGADGGGDAIGDAGLVPSAIIGDLDSLKDRAGWESRTRVIHIPEQITTDFQKALYSTEAPVTLALGMTGKRLDHTLAALSAVLQFAPQRRLLVVDEVDVALAVVGPLAFEAGVGERGVDPSAGPGQFHALEWPVLSAGWVDARARWVARDLERGDRGPGRDRAGGRDALAADPGQGAVVGFDPGMTRLRLERGFQERQAGPEAAIAPIVIV